MTLPPVVQQFIADTQRYEAGLDRMAAALRAHVAQAARTTAAYAQVLAGMGAQLTQVGFQMGAAWVGGMGRAIHARLPQLVKDILSEIGPAVASVGAVFAAPALFAGRRLARVVAPVARRLGQAGGFLANNQATRAAARAAGRAAALAARGARAGAGVVGRVIRSGLRRAAGMARFVGMAGLFALPALFGAASLASIKLAADLEQTKTAFEVMTGSGQAAAKMLADINKVAVQSPFTIKELREQAKALKAFGLGNEEIVPVMRMLGDVSAATGTAMERIVLAYGQIRAQGRLMGPELRQLTDAGIPILDYLSRVKGRPKIAIRGMVTEGLVSDADVHQAFMEMTGPGGQFFNMMARQANTVKGLFSNLQDYAQQAMERLGTAFLKGFGVGDLLDRVGKGIQDIGNMDTSRLEAFFGRLREIFDVILTAVQAIGEVLQERLVKGLESFSGQMDWSNWKEVAVGAIKAAVGAFGLLMDGIKEAALQAMGMVEQIAQGLVDAGFIKDKKAGPSAYEWYRQNGGITSYKFFAAMGAIGEDVFGYSDERNKQLFGIDPSKNKNPIAGTTDRLRKLLAGPSFAGQFGEAFDRLLGQQAAAPKESPADKEARRVREVEARIQGLRDEFAVKPLVRGLSQQAIELGGKTLGDYMLGKGGPLGIFQEQMSRFQQLAAYREEGSGFGFFSKDLEENARYIRFGQVAAFKQLAAGVGRQEYQPLEGYGAGSKEEGEIIARSRSESTDLLTEIRNTLLRAEQMQKQQVEYDAAIAQVLQEVYGNGQPIVVGGR